MILRLRVAELIAASNAFFFGAWILFASFRSDAFRIRIIYAPEWVWSVLPLTAGLCLALSVWRGNRAGGKVGRLIGTISAMIFFVGTTVVFSLTNHEITSLPLYLHAAFLYALLAIVEASSRNE